MQRVQLANGAIATSRLGLGTSRLHYLPGADRQRLLGAALDLGILHFDTAPSYGDGLAEAELGAFLKGRRERAVVVTKYGLPIDRLFEAMPRLQFPLRVMRSFARRAGFWRQKMPSLTASGLRASVEASLRRLKTDRIDAVLLHEPAAQRLANSEAVFGELQNLQARGVIGAFGLAGKWDGVRSVLDACPGLAPIVQTGEWEWGATRTPDITYGAVSGGEQSFWSDQRSGDDARGRLARALSRRPNGVVLVSTTKLDHLRSLAEAANASRAGTPA